MQLAQKIAMAQSIGLIQQETLLDYQAAQPAQADGAASSGNADVDAMRREKAEGEVALDISVGDDGVRRILALCQQILAPSSADPAPVTMPPPNPDAIPAPV